jgi:UDP-N-acetylglucosamine--N-acetylmuramyl-(pentapeptide) pyrophosphoryl-undecaprenol N-acetylglucosamine transferase
MKPSHFLMAAGGTGGHVIPGLAVARELRQRGHHATFVGTRRGLECKLVPAEGFELKLINVGALNSVSLARKLTTLAQLPFSTLACLREHSDAVFSMGGYVAGPPVMAALIRGAPVVVMEPNAVPGFTNRVIGRFVSRALVSFDETIRYFPAGRTKATGLPVREEFFHIAPKPRSAILNVLITGGSLGSRTLNQAARESWPLFRKSGLSIRIVHQTGASAFEQLRPEFAEAGINGEIVPFIANMPGAFAEADLIVCRSGAGAVSELAAAGKPAILVPFPFAADDHQARNAEAMERGGAAHLVLDAEMTGERLFDEIVNLARDESALERMAAAARQFAKPGAAGKAADVLEEAAGG